MVRGLWIVSLIGCSADSSSDRPPFVVRDSGGVQVIESHAAAWGDERRWRVDSVPTISFSGDGSEPLYQVVDVVETPDQDIVIGQRDGILLFDSAGALVRRIAHSGQGPGEFSALSSVSGCADVVLATDRTRFDLIAVDLAGELVRTQSLPRSGRGGVSSWRVLTCGADDVVLHGSGARVGRDAGRQVTRDSLVVVRLLRAGGDPDTILRVPGAEAYDGLTVPFGRVTLIAANGDEIHVLDTGAPEIRVFRGDGVLSRIIRLPALDARQITDSDLERRRAEYADGVPPDLYEREIRPRLDAVPIPETMPYFSDLKVADDGTVWLRAYRAFRDVEVLEWLVLSRRGEWLGRVRLPARFRPHHFTGQQILGVWRDERDVEHVRSYGIIIPDSTSGP